MFVYCLPLAKSSRHLMPRDAFPETKLNISMALQISDCFVIEGSDVIMPLGQPRDWRVKGSDWEAYFIKTSEFQYVLLLATRQTQASLLCLKMQTPCFPLPFTSMAGESDIKTNQRAIQTIFFPGLGWRTWKFPSWKPMFLQSASNCNREQPPRAGAGATRAEPDATG